MQGSGQGLLQRQHDGGLDGDAEAGPEGDARAGPGAAEPGEEPRGDGRRDDRQEERATATREIGQDRRVRLQRTVAGLVDRAPKGLDHPDPFVHQGLPSDGRRPQDASGGEPHGEHQRPRAQDFTDGRFSRGRHRPTRASDGADCPGDEPGPGQGGVGCMKGARAGLCSVIRSPVDSGFVGFSGQVAEYDGLPAVVQPRQRPRHGPDPRPTTRFSAERDISVIARRRHRHQASTDRPTRRCPRSARAPPDRLPAIVKSRATVHSEQNGRALRRERPQALARSCSLRAAPPDGRGQSAARGCRRRQVGDGSAAAVAGNRKGNGTAALR